MTFLDEMYGIGTLADDHDTEHNGDTATGHLGAVVQNTRNFSRFRFAVTSHPGIFEIQVGQFSLAGLDGRKEARFL